MVHLRLKGILVTFIYRLVQVCNPLHYKRLVTKRRLHLTYFVLGFYFAVEFCSVFIFLRKSFTQDHMCVIPNVLRSVGISIMVVNFGTASLVTTVCYICVIVKLKKRKKQMSSLTYNTNPNAVNTDLKVTKAILLTLGTYLSLYIPTIVIGLLVHNVDAPCLIIILAVCMLLYYVNNLVNPFIYYFTLRDFKQEYNKLLSCKGKKENLNQKIKVAVV